MTTQRAAHSRRGMAGWSTRDILVKVVLGLV